MSAQPAETFARALGALQAGRLEDAARDFEKFLQADPRHFGALNLYSIVLMQMNRFSDAAPVLRTAISVNPNSDKTFYNYGLALKKLKKFEEAYEAFSNAIKLDARSPETWNNRGTVLNDLRRFDEAITDFNQAIALAPGYAEALSNKARSLFAAERFDDAIRTYREALRFKPNLAEAWTGLGLVLLKRKQYEEALAANNNALRIDNHNVYGWQGIGNVFSELNRHDQALAAYDQAIKLNPNFTEAWIHRGSMLLRLRKYQDALTAFSKAVAIEPERASVWSGLGDAYYGLHRSDEARSAYDKALAFDDRLATAWHGRGNIFLALNRDDEALSCLNKAIEIQPDQAESHFSKAVALLSRGDFHDGWEEYEWRLQLKDLAPHDDAFSNETRLRNSQIAGKAVLIHAEQGLGDTIQFYRYVTKLHELGCRITFAVQPPLVSLISAQKTGITIISREAALPDFDLHCPLMSLPHFFRTSVETIPASIPYLSAPSQSVRRWQTVLAKKTRPRIGLVWSGNPIYIRNISRNIPLRSIGQILNTAVEWHCLQKDIAEADRTALQTITEIVDHSSSLTDFSETAALIAEMDLVISVDTSVAHLAGALGKPVWILLPYHPDFRWLRNRTDSPWYPTARLFRQSEPDDWDGPLQKISEELAKTVQAAGVA